MRSLKFGIAGVTLVLWAVAGLSCATSGSAQGDGEAASESSASEGTSSASEARAEASDEETAERLPDPQSRPEEGDGKRGEGECVVEDRDWKKIDFRDATALHRTLTRESDVFASCLEALPGGTKFYVTFRVEEGNVTAAEPADLSKLETRRLDTSEREKMVECLEATVEEANFSAEAAESSYEVTHPFCAP